MALKHFSSLLLAGLSTSCNALATASRDITITTIPSTSHYEIGIDSTGYRWPWRVYKTSTFHPPNMTITRSGAPLADGYIFMTPWPNSNETHQNAGFIMTDEGDMVYCVPIVGMHNFRVQEYDGQSYLTYWNGYNAAFPQVGHGYGQVTFVDSELKNSSVKGLDLGINTLTNSTRAYGVFDIHEAQMTGRDSLLVTVYNNTQADLTSLGGAVDGWIVDCLVFEIDVATGEVLFEWKALDHFPLSLSRQPLVTTLGNGTIGAPYDWFHMNSIERVGSDYLVSARHVYSIFMVSGEDGSVLWHLDGETGGDFAALPSDRSFRWQHDARVYAQSESSIDISLFDNQSGRYENNSVPRPVFRFSYIQEVCLQIQEYIHKYRPT